MNEDFPVPLARISSLTFRCCRCSNRTGFAEAYVLEDGDLSCTRCVEAELLDKVEVSMLMES
jgi:hypothetical protein